LPINRIIILKIINIMKRFIYISLAFLMAAVACRKEETPLSLSTDTVTFGAAGGSQTVELTSGSAWTLSTDGQSWYSVTPDSGNGNTLSITIKAEPYSEAAGRSGVITVTSSSSIKTINVIQDITLKEGSSKTLFYSINRLAQDITIPIDGNGYEVKVPSGITLKSSENGQYVVSVSENTSEALRKYQIEVTRNGSTIETVLISQSWRTVDPGQLVISEIFFTGMSLEDGSSDGMDGDQYVKLTNNSDDTIYADGLLFVMSDRISNTSSTGAEWTYPTLKDSIDVATVYAIPGNGQDYPIAAGESIVLAISAQNFKAENGNGLDLSVANFEFYDESEYVTDTDNDDVDNLICWFKSSWSLTYFHNRGYMSIAMVCAPSGMTAETFMTNYVWVGQRVMNYNGYSFEQDIDGSYLVPNDWVIDGVNCAVKQDLGTLVFNASIDAGYTNVTDKDSDPERFGKSVVRKTDASGKYVDTNNSTNDFEVSTPTLQ